MVRVLLAMHGGLLRGALRHVLTAEPDIDVIGECDAVPAILHRVRDDDPDVTVLDLDLLGDVVGSSNARRAARQAHAELPDVKVLVLVDPRRPGFGRGIDATPISIGFLAHTAPPERVIDAVRRLNTGERVIDADILAEALNGTVPLTESELRVLQVAAAGLRVKEIAAHLSLAPGTVRNHLTRIITKTGARNRIEAIHIAQRSGWI